MYIHGLFTEYSSGLIFESIVYHDGDKTRTFALKALKKKHIVDTRQQVRIHTRDGERNSVRSVFFRKRKK